MQLDNILSTRQFQDRSLLQRLFASAERLEKLDALHQLPPSLAGKIIATIFYEPSTRTRLSFECAVLKLGGQIVTSESAGMFSSAVKGETLADTIRVLNGYVDGVVLRHKDKGAADEAAHYASIPIINAGDGTGEHPTQALLDLYTIDRERVKSEEFHMPLASPEGLHIALVGDLLKGRTVHSLALLLPLLGPVKVSLVSPESLQLPSEYKNFLNAQGVEVDEFSALEAVLPDADVIYMTRIQKERAVDGEAPLDEKDFYCLGLPELAMMQENAIILHPLPRVKEIATEVDSDPRAKYFEQTRHGLYMRMALLEELFAPRA